MGTGFVGGAIGNTVVGYFVKKYKKTWFVGAVLCSLCSLYCTHPLSMCFYGIFLWNSSSLSGSICAFSPLPLQVRTGRRQTKQAEHARHAASMRSMD